MPYNLEQIILGIRAAEKGDRPLLSDDEYYSLIHKFQEEALTKQTENNLHETESFLKIIAVKNGVIELIKDKLYCEIIQEGKGDPISINTPILASYIAKVLENNQLKSVFQSEHSPMEISLQDTIPGFAQGVAGMLKGEKRVIYIHPDLAYGATAAKVEPNQLIVIEVCRANEN
jgi:FKBP-type peptidyl-prolyl cis-trans isomerase